MTRIRTTRTRSVIILLTYLLLILAPPVIRETCCTEDHHDSDHEASAAGQFVLLEMTSHLPDDGLRQKVSQIAQPVEKKCSYASHCCSGHHHHFSGCDCNTRIVLLRHSSKGEPSRSSLYTTTISDNVSAGLDYRLFPGNVLADIPTIVSLQSTVLLI